MIRPDRKNPLVSSGLLLAGNLSSKQVLTEKPEGGDDLHVGMREDAADARHTAAMLDVSAADARYVRENATDAESDAASTASRQRMLAWAAQHAAETEVGEIEAEIRRLTTIDVLIVDDFALRALDATQTNDFYEIVVERHRRASTIWVSNREPAEWLGLTTDALLAQSAIDRLTSGAHPRRRRPLVPPTRARRR